jgi:hypothetical protein
MGHNHIHLDGSLSEPSSYNIEFRSPTQATLASNRLYNDSARGCFRMDSVYHCMSGGLDEQESLQYFV